MLSVICYDVSVACMIPITKSYMPCHDLKKLSRHLPALGTSEMMWVGLHYYFRRGLRSTIKVTAWRLMEVILPCTLLTEVIPAVPSDQGVFSYHGEECHWNMAQCKSRQQQDSSMQVKASGWQWFALPDQFRESARWIVLTRGLMWYPIESSPQPAIPCYDKLCT